MDKKVRRLPEAEFLIMDFIWNTRPPVTTLMILNSIGKERNWKLQTIVSLFSRLTEKGFLRIENTGKKTRSFYPQISRDEYLRQEAKTFMDFNKIKSPVSLMDTLYNGKVLSNNDIDELENWLNKVRNEGS